MLVSLPGSASFTERGIAVRSADMMRQHAPSSRWQCTQAQPQTLAHTRHGSWDVQKHQAIGQLVCTRAAPKDNAPVSSEPGATRKATVRDATRLAKIFGPSRYPAFVPDESLVSRSAPPPPTRKTSAPPSPALNPFMAPRRGKPVAPPAKPGVPAPPTSPADAKAVVRNARHWRDLVPLLARGPQLGAGLLVELARRLEELSFKTPVLDEQEGEELKAAGEQLATATRMFLGSAFTLPDTTLVLRALVATGVVPTENWLMAVEVSSASTMHAALSAFARSLVEGKSNEAAQAQLLTHVQEILRLSAGLLSVRYTPREAWLEQFLDCTTIVLSNLADATNEHLSEADSPAITNIRNKARTGGLISVPEQFTPDQVVNAEGDEVELEPEVGDPRPHEAASLPPVASGWETLPQLGHAEWGALAQALLLWELPVNEEWLQYYLDASYGALSMTRAAVTEELDGNGSMGGRAPLAARVLDTSVVADLATSLLRNKVRPSENWLAMMEAASGVVFQRVIAGGDSGFTAQPVAVVNLLLVGAECGRPLRQEWVEAALLAAAADQGMRVPGDHLAMLMFEAGRPGWELKAEVVSAATVLAGRAGKLWDEQAQLDRQKAARGQRAETEGEQDVTGFSAKGLAFLIMGLQRLGALHLMPARWLQAWGDQAVVRSQDFDVAATVVSLQAAVAAGVTLPARAIHVLGGQVLEAMHRAGAAASGNAPAPRDPSDSDADEDDQSRSASTEAWLELLDALAQQPVQLPAPWLTLVQDLTIHHLHATQPEQMLKALQVLGLVPEVADPGFLRTVLEAYGRQGGLGSPEGCVAMAGALVGAGTDAQLLQVVDEASVACFPSGPGEGHAAAWAALLSALAVGGHMPSQRFWEGLASATSDVQALSLQELCELMVAHSTLRMARPTESAALGTGWLDSLAVEASRRIPLVASNQAALVPLINAMSSMYRDWPLETLQDLERACEAHGAQLAPAAITASILIFGRCQHTAGPSWCGTAISALSSQLDTADGQDLVAFLAGFRQQAGLQAAVPAGLLPAVIDSAGRRAAANQIRPAQLVGLVSAARELREAGVTVVPAGGSSKAVGALLERALNLREMMSDGEVCELVRSVRGLGVKPTTRWTSTMLARFDASADLLDAGPEAAAHVASCLDAWNTTVSPAMLDNMCASLVRMTAACVNARGLLDAGEERPETPLEIVREQLPPLVGSTVQLLQAVVNLQGGQPADAQARMGGHRERVLSNLAAMLNAGDVPPDLHDSLLYSAARMHSSETERRAELAAAKQAEKEESAGTDEEPSSSGESMEELTEAALAATRAHLASYSPNQLGMVFSTLASMGSELPTDWLELFWEYSRGQLRSYTLELLLAVMSGLTVVAPSNPPPRVWEDTLWESLQARAPQCSVLEVQALLRCLFNARMQPPAPVLQALLDGALSDQQTTAARLEEAQAAAASASATSHQPSSTGANGRGTAREASTASTAGTAREEEAVEEFIGSTRTTARRRGQADGTGRNARGAPQTAVAAAPVAQTAAATSSAVQASIAAKAVGAAAAQQAFQLGQVVGQVVLGWGYMPDRSWLGTCQELLKPALASPQLPLKQRSDLANLLKKITEAQDAGL